MAVDGERQISVRLRVRTAWTQLFINLFLKLFGEVYLLH